MVETAKKFKKAYIEITNACNFSCDFCVKTSRKKQFITVENFERALSQVAQFTNHIYLHVLGEPLLHPDLPKLLSVAASHGLNVNITTNGALITQNLPALLAQKVRKISFSLHSYSANNNGDNYSNYLNNILNAVDSLKQNTICELRFWNEQQGKFNTDNVGMLDHIYTHFNQAQPPQNSLGKGVKLQDNVFLGFDSRFEWANLLNSTNVTQKFCYGLRDQFAVLVDGTVTPCCIDAQGDIPLGNIYQSPLASILNCDRAKRLYQSFCQNKVVEELCKHCAF